MQREIKFRVYSKEHKKMLYYDTSIVPTLTLNGVLELPMGRNDLGVAVMDNVSADFDLMEYTGLHDKNGKEIYEGDIVGEEMSYHFLEREGWQPEQYGRWKIIGEKTGNFMGKEEKYIAGYRLSTVEWLQSSCGFEPFSDSEENCGHCGGGMNSRNVEVIGNIYESPELLKERE